MAKVRKATFLGKTFKVVCARPPQGKLGGVTSRDDKRPTMILDDRLRDVQLFEVALHEAIHACFDEKLNEEVVTKAGLDITRFMVRLLSDPRWIDRQK